LRPFMALIYHIERLFDYWERSGTAPNKPTPDKSCRASGLPRSAPVR
jgi:hypothetical protein